MFYNKIVLFLLLCACDVECDLNLPEGSACTANGVNGTCVTLYKCYSAALNTLLTRGGYDKGPGMPAEICSYTADNEPIYCCTDCGIDTEESLKDYVVVPFGDVVQREKSISWSKCVDYFQSLPFRCRGNSLFGVAGFYLTLNETGNCHSLRNFQVATGHGAGGRDADRWEFPHMALLGFGADQDSAQWLCGGSVISERFILTAAHCTSYPSLGNLTFAALGVLKRSDLKEFWKVYKIKRIIVYPEYQSPSKYHDIALLETDNEINFGRGLLPACLVSVVSLDFGSEGEAPGWGRLGHNKPIADVLQVLKLKEFDEKSCSAIFPEHRHLKQGYNHTTQACFGALTKSAITDTCEGDSGGPLQHVVDCMFVVYGVTSYGKDCGNIGSAGMYTKVEFYVPWIESVVWPELYKGYND